MSIETLSLRTPEEVKRSLAERFKNLRLRKGWKQETLASRSGVSLGSLKRFETLGEISLKRLLNLAHALGCLYELDQLIQPSSLRSLEELEWKAAQSHPKRGRI